MKEKLRSETGHIEEVVLSADQVKISYQMCLDVLSKPDIVKTSKGELFRVSIKKRLDQLINTLNQDGLARLIFKFPIGIEGKDGGKDYFFLPKKRELVIGALFGLKVLRRATDDESFDHTMQITDGLLKSIEGFDLEGLHQFYKI